jgi:hypothetical protein
VLLLHNIHEPEKVQLELHNNIGIWYILVLYVLLPAVTTCVIKKTYYRQLFHLLGYTFIRYIIEPL